MLILSRREGESLRIGEDTRITVFSVHGKQVKLGLDVPQDTLVYREELYQRVREENTLSLLDDNNDFLTAAKTWQKKK